MIGGDANNGCLVNSSFHAPFMQTCNFQNILGMRSGGSSMSINFLDSA